MTPAVTPSKLLLINLIPTHSCRDCAMARPASSICVNKLIIRVLSGRGAAVPTGIGNDFGQHRYDIVDNLHQPIASGFARPFAAPVGVTALRAVYRHTHQLMIPANRTECDDPDRHILKTAADQPDPPSL